MKLMNTKISSPLFAMLSFFFGAGFIISCLITNFLKTSLYAPILNIYQTTLSGLQTLEIDSVSLFLLAAGKHLKYLLLLWFFSFTNIWKYYYRLFTAYEGIQNGFLLSFCLIMNGTAGILGYLCLLLPHSLLLLPAYVLSIQRCQCLHEGIFACSPARESARALRTTKKQVVLHELPCFLLCLCLLLLGCLLEGYVNPLFLRLFFR